MGLFQILSRRSGKAKSRDHVVQQHEGSQSTDSGADNVSKIPPMGLNRDAQFSKLSLNLSDDSDLAAPPPFVPTFSPFSSQQRPGSSRSTRSNHSFTGMFGQQRTPQRPKREARKPPVSFRKPASLASISNGYQPSAYGADDGSDAGSIYATRQRTNSIKSTTSGRSRDLLDVLEEIRPVEFRSRVLAAGARDYGEDVADRNIRQSRVTLSTPNLKSQFDTDRGSSSLSWRTGSSMRSRTRSPSSFTSSRLAAGYTPGEYFENAQREASAASNFLEPGSFSSRNKNRLSLNTYIPSGLDAPHTPPSNHTTPSYREGIASRDFGSIGSIASESEGMSRKYHLSPTSSNFSVPRSPRAVAHEPLPKQADLRSEIAARAVESTNEQQPGDMLAANGTGHQWKSGASGRNNSLPRTSVRFSNQTYRSSLASSMTSRNTSLDFTPLGHPPSCPRLRSNSITDLKHPEEGETTMRIRPLSMHSHRASRSDSSEDGARHSRTRSLIGAPSVLRNLLEEDEMGMSARFSGNRDWTMATPSNGSTTSSSNLYASSSGRPVSRHTKATSVDSTSHAPSSSRKSEDSIMSAPYHGQQSGATWSPATTRSTGFNIDDYISSDEESFTTEKRHQRPTADGEEELLWKNGFNGALPGLLEPMDDICPAPVVRLTRSQSRERPATSHAAPTQRSGERRPSAARRMVDDDQISMDRDMPGTLLRHVRSGPEDGNLGTFGRRTKKPMRDHVVAVPTPSSGTEEEWATPSETMTYENKNMATSPPRGYFNQKRLSALGTLHGRSLDLGVVSSPLSDAASFPAASSSISGRELAAPATIPEAAEKLDHAAAIRLRKEAKARKRAEEARSAREKRMTRAFGDLEEDIAAMLMAQGEAAELGRGRKLSRGRSPQDKGKGKAVALE